MVSRLSAFVIWALVAGAAVFWSVRLLASPLQAPPQTTTVSATVAPRGDVARLLGATPPAATAAAAVPDAAARFKLLGVVAPRRADAAGAQGVALLAVDGKPPRAVRIGASVEGDWRLQSVSARGATLAGPGGTIELEMPPLPTAATGRLPPVDAAPSGGVAPAPAPVVAPPNPTTPPPPAMVPPTAVMPGGVDAQTGQPPVPPPAGYIPPTAR